MQQALLRYYGNALKDLTCHNIDIYSLLWPQLLCFSDGNWIESKSGNMPVKKFLAKDRDLYLLSGI
jgi:hypothetical protein